MAEALMVALVDAPAMGRKKIGRLLTVAVTRTKRMFAAAADPRAAQPVEPSGEYSVTVPLKAVVPKFHLFTLADTALSALVRPDAVPSSCCAAARAAASA